jgi:hypothetical protein
MQIGNTMSVNLVPRVPSNVSTVRLRGTRLEPFAVYDQKDWRKAINRYLDQIWSQQNDDAEGLLFFGDIMFSLQNGKYDVQYPAATRELPRPQFSRGEIHAVTSKRNEFELGLTKFVRNNSMRLLVIEFPDLRFMLWKGLDRTDLFATVIDRTF